MKFQGTKEDVLVTIQSSAKTQDGFLYFFTKDEKYWGFSMTPQEMYELGMKLLGFPGITHVLSQPGESK